MRGRVLLPVDYEDGIPWIQVYAIPATPEGKPHLAATLQLPARRSLFSVGISIGPPVPCGVPCELLQIQLWPDNSIFVPLWTIFSFFNKDNPPYLQWADWGPSRTRLITRTGLYGPRIIGTSGNHVVLTDSILDFNQYDIDNDVYGPEVAHGRVLRTSGNNYSGAVHRDPVLWPLESSIRDSDIPCTTLAYRKVHLTFPRVRCDMKFLIEEENGPMVRSRCNIPFDHKCDAYMTDCRHRHGSCRRSKDSQVLLHEILDVPLRPSRDALSASHELSRGKIGTVTRSPLYAARKWIYSRCAAYR